MISDIIFPRSRRRLFIEYFFFCRDGIALVRVSLNSKSRGLLFWWSLTSWFLAEVDWNWWYEKWGSGTPSQTNIGPKRWCLDASKTILLWKWNGLFSGHIRSFSRGVHPKNLQSRTASLVLSTIDFFHAPWAPRAGFPLFKERKESLRPQVPEWLMVRQVSPEKFEVGFSVDR